MVEKTYTLRCYNNDIDKGIVELLESIPKGKKNDFLRQAVLSYKNNAIILESLSNFQNNINELKEQIENLAQKLDSVSISKTSETVENTNVQQEKPSEDKQTEIKRQAFINSMVAFGKDF